jgi:hypothetical protein
MSYENTQHCCKNYYLSPMDIDTFLRRELMTRAPITNLVFKLTYEEIKRITLTYAGLQQPNSGTLPTPGVDGVYQNN